MDPYLRDDEMDVPEQISSEMHEHLEALYRKEFPETAEENERFGGITLFGSAPGRMELAGNHTDHQGGCVISAAIDERIYGLAKRTRLPKIRFYMEGFGEGSIDVSQAGWHEPRPEEYGTSASIVRGMAASHFDKWGFLPCFDFVTDATLPSGCGLSSSAAFEMLVGILIDGLCGVLVQSEDDHNLLVSADPISLAQSGCAVERDYFGKSAGAQDQMVSAIGGVLALDFSEERPKAEQIPYCAENAGYSSVLVDSRQDHSLHNDEFCQVTSDMREVAGLFGKDRLEDVGEDVFFAGLGDVRDTLGDK
ncbi:MAG: hypothetical protein LUB61_02270, partial [Eggerthellaceae bacterium]|nr:hypothetical protein [Eggerthellaceae bacterium]